MYRRSDRGVKDDECAQGGRENRRRYLSNTKLAAVSMFVACVLVSFIWMPV